MVDYLPRSAWDARPARPGPGDLTVSRVKGAVLHWPGMESRRLFDQADVADALRGWQAYHMDSKGWSDIAYQVAVDQAGRAWTLRGLREQSGANGNNAANEDYGAILLVVGTGEAPTPAMIATTREVVRDFRGIYLGGTRIRPHSDVRAQYTGSGTDCPGDLVRDLITRGAFEPIARPAQPTEQPDTPEVFDMAVTVKDLDDLAAKYVGGDNDHDAQVLCWQVAAQSYSDARYAELVSTGTAPRDALLKVKDELWPILRPLWG